MATQKKPVDPRIEIAAIAERALIKYPNGEPARIEFAMREIRRSDVAVQIMDALAEDGMRVAINAAEYARRKAVHWTDESDDDTPKFDKAAARAKEPSPEMLRLRDRDRVSGVLSLIFQGKRIGDMTKKDVVAAKTYSLSSAHKFDMYGSLFAWIEARMKDGKRVRDCKQIVVGVEEFWKGIRDA